LGPVDGNLTKIFIFLEDRRNEPGQDILERKKSGKKTTFSSVLTKRHEIDKV
jgi:hypothetical protein